MLPKWTQIIASGVLTLLSAGVLVRDLLYHDRRTTIHRKLTYCLVSILVIAVGALSWATYKTFPEPPPQPAFAFFVNSQSAETGTVLPLNITNRTGAIIVAVQNHGSASAERLTVDVVFPKGVVTPSTGWSEETAGFEIADGKLQERSSLVHYRIEATGLIEPTCFFVCPPFSIRDGVVLPQTIGFAVIAASTPGPRNAVGLMLSLINKP